MVIYNGDLFFFVSGSLAQGFCCRVHVLDFCPEDVLILCTTETSDFYITVLRNLTLKLDQINFTPSPYYLWLKGS